jgi:hypothetical protein
MPISVFSQYSAASFSPALRPISNASSLIPLPPHLLSEPLAKPSKDPAFQIQKQGCDQSRRSTPLDALRFRRRDTLGERTWRDPLGTSKQPQELAHL